MDKGIVFNIQRYSLHDGTGIRTVVFLKGCPLRCQWCSNPESQIAKLQMVFSSDKCIACGKCSGLNSLIAGTVNSAKAEFCEKNYENAMQCPTGAIEIIGKEMPIEEIIQEVEKDREFYETSGGGVTISGGEPLVQWEFAAKLIRELKLRYFHVAIETTGYAPWEHAEKVLSQCDMILYDIKHMNSEAHEKYMGIPNELILQNAEKIAEKKLNMVFRIPLMGGINTDEKNISEVARFAEKLGVKEIHILPYHRFGEGKYKKMKMEYTCEAYTPGDEEINRLKGILELSGLTVGIGG